MGNERAISKLLSTDTRSNKKMIIQTDNGLANRLRVIFSRLKPGIDLEVVWPINDQCNGHFSDCFADVDSIRFVSEPTAKVTFRGSTIAGEPDYRKLKPNSDIVQAVSNNTKLLAPNFVAVHVRRTDHSRLALRRGNFTSDETFFRFLDTSSLPIYIACDCPETQIKFVDRYPDRIPMFHSFENTTKLRKSSLKQAVTDIFTCVEAQRFMGSGWSSYSDLIRHLRDLRFHRSENGT